jgi:hypothetical protein
MTDPLKIQQPDDGLIHVEGGPGEVFDDSAFWNSNMIDLEPFDLGEADVPNQPGR